MNSGGSKGGQTFFSMTFGTAFLTNLAIGGNSGTDALMASLSAAAGEVFMSYRPQKSDGSLGDPITGGWSMIKNRVWDGNPEALVGLMSLGAFSATPEGFSVQVGAVPEPSTYALMIAGLGLMVYMVRRRSRA